VCAQRPATQASGHGTSTSGLSYHNEYVFILHAVTDSGGLATITSIEETCDSAALGAFLGQMASSQK
jgi:hypothetical protein